MIPVCYAWKYSGIMGLTQLSDPSGLKNKVLHYRELAQKALCRAGRTYDVELCEHLLAIANGWKALADELEQHIGAGRIIDPVMQGA